MSELQTVVSVETTEVSEMVAGKVIVELAFVPGSLVGVPLSVEDAPFNSEVDAAEDPRADVIALLLKSTAWEAVVLPDTGMLAVVVSLPVVLEEFLETDGEPDAVSVCSPEGDNVQGQSVIVTVSPLVAV